MDTTPRLPGGFAGRPGSPAHQAEPSITTPVAPERYSQAQATPLDRDALSGLNLVVVGAGALGNEVVKALGLLGVGSVLIVDPDAVEKSNLARSAFFREADCGRPKALALGETLANTFPDTRWESRQCEIADLGLGELADCHLMMSCVDSDIARVEIAWAGLALDLPVADAGLGGPNHWHGRVSFFAGRRSACFCCKLSPRRRQEILFLAQAAAQSCWGAHQTQPTPSTPAMAAITGSLQVDMGLRSLFELRQSIQKEYPSWTFAISLAAGPETQRFTTLPSPHCPLHSLLPELRPLPHARASARELLDSAALELLELDWPICISAGCLDCGTVWQPRRRVAWLRRYGRCPACSGCHILEKENIRSLRRDSLWAAIPLIDLGLPDRHLYTMRPSLAGDKK
jgi:ThiF family protein